MSDEDWLLEQILLGEAVLRGLFRGALARLQEDFHRPADEVAALLLERGDALRHLIPDAAERVVGEKLDDVAGSKELIADGQLAAISRGRRFLTHLLPLGRVIVILIDPADRLVFGPEFLQVGVVEQGEQGKERLFAGEKERLRRASIKERAEIDGQLVEQAEQVAAVAVVGVADR